MEKTQRQHYQDGLHLRAFSQHKGIGMAKRKAQGRAKQSKAKLPDAVLQTLHKQRERIFQAQGIVSCARYASDSMLVPKGGEPNLVDGLAAASTILSDVAEALGELLPVGYGDADTSE